MSQTSTPKPRYSKEEFALRGDEIYDRDIRPHVGPDDEGKFVVIDIETGAHEIDQDELVASDRLLARRLDAQMWTRQVGSRYVRRFKPRYKTNGFICRRNKNLHQNRRVLSRN